MNAKIGVLFLVAVIASAGIGASYSCYSNGVGSPLCKFKVGIGILGTGDPGPNYMQPGGSLYPSNPPNDGTADPNYSPGSNPEGKNVACTNGCNGTYHGRMWINGKWVNFYKDISVTADNTYPWYASSVTFWFGNCESIPAKLKNCTLQGVSGWSELLKFMVVDGWTLKKNDVVIYSGSTWDDLVTKMKLVVLCHKDRLTVFLSFHFIEEYTCGGVVHVMPQGASVSFTLKTVWKQAC